MRFKNQRESSNIEDQRGGAQQQRSGGRNPLSGLRLPGGKGKGIAGLLIVAAIAYFSGGINGVIGALTGGGGGLGGAISGASYARQTPTVSSNSETPLRTTPEEEALKKFVGQVLATTETCWHELFEQKYGRRYEEPQLVLFRDAVRSACGEAGSSMGPFYCPGDHKVYIDLSFLDEMDRTLGARGDFAQAYVIAHEVGHHVQNLLGTSRKVQGLRGRVSSAEYNKASVKLELQADYFAGCWAHYVRHKLKGQVELEVGDYQEAIGAAHAVGDDTLQKRATGRVVPENFTHGTAKQRAKWFRLGYEGGDPTARDPFEEER